MKRTSPFFSKKGLVTNIYGEKVSSILREHPFMLLHSPLSIRKISHHDEIQWLNENLEKLVQHIEKYFCLDILLAEI